MCGSSQASCGSGFFITDDGYVLTNYHVISTAHQYGYAVSVLTYDGTTYQATIVGVDEDNDIALLKIDASGLPFVKTGDAERTKVGEYRLQGRGGLGIKVAKLSEDRGDLAGGLMVSDDDEVLVVLASGKVVRSAVAEVPAKGRDTMGVVFARPDDDDRILAIARNGERTLGQAPDLEEPATPAAADETTPASPEESDTDA